MRIKVETSISQIIAELNRLQAETGNYLRGQISLDVAVMIQKQTQENIRRTFGKGNGPRSEITMRAYGNSARRSGRGGGLMNSVLVAQNSQGEASVTVGGTGVPYAVIQEEGGVIRPGPGKEYLTIPFQPRFSGTRAGEHDLRFSRDPKWGPILRIPGRASLKSEAMIAFLLRRRSTIPARPYFQPAIDEVTNDDKVRALMKIFMGSTKLDIQVK